MIDNRKNTRGRGVGHVNRREGWRDKQVERVYLGADSCSSSHVMLARPT